MKKSFIFTLAFAGILTACNNEEINNPQVDNNNNDDPVALRLSAKTSPIVVTKGMGSVGDLENNAANTWNGDTVYIYSFAKKNPDYTNTIKPDDNQTSGEAKLFIDNKKGIVNADGTIDWSDNGQTEYFPQLAAWDFFGYHIDDATADSKNPTKEVDKIYFNNVTIDGSQDLMIAKAELTDAQKTDWLSRVGLSDATTEEKEAEFAKAFSAYSARKYVQPTMIFKHLLSRLQFKIYPGIEEADKVFIKSIEVKSKATGKLVVVAVNDADRGFIVDPATTPISLFLQERVSGAMQTLTKRYYHPATFNNSVTEQTETQVGESLLVVPQDSYDINIEMEQNVGDLVEDWRNTTFSTTLKLSTAEGTAKSFEAGYSYLVKITVFGLQKVNIEAILQGWQAGDDITLNPDDEF